MKRSLSVILALFVLMLSVSASVAQVSAVPQLMNFQGRLARPDGTPVADGTYTLRFSLWNALSGGTERWSHTLPVVVHNSTFIALLGGPNGTMSGPLTSSLFAAPLWLEIKVGVEAPLTPRQPFVTVAHAFKADSVKDGSITASSLASGTLNTLSWLLGGNSGTNPAIQFLGTTDDQPLVFKVNNRRAMRYQYAENTANPGFEYRGINILGGSELNRISPEVVGATIAGGGLDYYIRSPNSVTGNFGTVGGGIGNTSGDSATVAGGDVNTASGDLATVGGGGGNTSSGYTATVAGGRFNTASGSYSFAAGRQAKAIHTGAFVWADEGGGPGADFPSTANNQFLIRASGGVGINTNSPSPYILRVIGNVGASGFTTVSDARYKENVATFPDALETILSLRGVTFDWKQKDFPDMDFSARKQIGFIAQEVEKVLPELVTTDSKGYKAVAYANVVPVLVEAVKTLKKDNDTARAKNAELEARLERLEAILRNKEK